MAKRVTTTRKRAAAVVLAPVATLVGLALGAEPAGAAALSRTDEHTITASDGSVVTCLIQSTQNIPNAGAPDEAYIRTRILPTSPPACFEESNSVGFRVTYDDPDGDQVNAVVGAFGNSVESTYRPVGSGLESTHSVRFSDCSANCFTPNYPLAQPK